LARRSQAEKAESRSRILSAAAGLIRQKGIERTSVAEVMDRAGMTHGGFYRHFDSKSDLVAEAIGEAFRAGLDVFDDEEAGTPDQVMEYVEQYLSEEHVLTPEIGCPLPTLSAEVARGAGPWRDSLSDGVDTATRKLAEGIEDAEQSDTLVVLSLLVGTLLLARGIGEGSLRDELLRASERHVRSITKLGQSETSARSSEKGPN